MTKEYKYIDFSKFEHKAVKDSSDYVGEFKGIAVEWDVPDRGTHLSDEDIIHKGAFEEQCREWKVDPSQVKGSIDHNLSKLGAVFTNVYESEKGLYVEGKFLNTTRGRDLYVEVKTKAKNSLSIGFIVGEHKWDGDTRHIYSFKEVYEISFVTFGSQKTANVEAKNKPETIREFEYELKKLGYSNNEAKQISEGGFKSLGQRDAESGHPGDENEMSQEQKEFFEKLMEVKPNGN